MFLLWWKNHKDIIKYVGESFNVKGDTGYYEKYYLYANDNLVDIRDRSNELEWTPNKVGRYQMKVLSINFYDNTSSEATVNINVENKDKRAPIIKNIDIKKESTEGENISANIKASGENVKYKYELIKYEASDEPTGYYVMPFRDVILLKDSNENSTFTWYEEPIAPIYNKYGERESYMSYTLRVTAENEYGYDFKNINFSAYDIIENNELREEFNIYDINNDRKVDIRDISFLGSIYNRTNLNANYRLCNDLNADGVIDIYMIWLN